MSEWSYLTLEDKVKLIYSKDDYDYSGTSKFKNSAKQCLACKKVFYPEGRTAGIQNYCKRTHYVDCVICGKPVLQKPVSVHDNGVKCACKGECSKKLKFFQTKSSIQEKYGYSNLSQVPQFKEKIAEGIKKSSSKMTENRLKTMQEKYGGSGTASPAIRKKIEATMMERYGVTNPSDSEEFRNKIKEQLKSKEVQEKRKNTSKKKYGVDYPAQSKEIQEQMKETTMKHYGVPFSGQILEAREQAKQTCIERYGVPFGFSTVESLEKARQSMLDNKTGRVSHINEAFIDKLKENGFDPYPELYIGRKSYDCALNDRNVVIEIDPSYTHSAFPNHWTHEGKSPTYHLERTKIAEEAGYRCIHVFDWDNWDKIISMLKSSEIIYARNCQLSEIDETTASKFIDEHHIQGKVKGTKKAYGLFNKGELVEVMTFGKARYSKKYEWELLRLCTETGFKVIGGASRLFKKFIVENNPSSIISYCDIAKFKGDVYLQLGFKLDHVSDPAKVWSKGTDYITDNLLRQRGYDQLFNTDYGKGTSNEELMVQHGWLPVHDCGQAVYSWKV